MLPLHRIKINAKNVGLAFILIVILVGMVLLGIKFLPSLEEPPSQTGETISQEETVYKYEATIDIEISFSNKTDFILRIPESSFFKISNINSDRVIEKIINNRTYIEINGTEYFEFHHRERSSEPIGGGWPNMSNLPYYLSFTSDSVVISIRDQSGEIFEGLSGCQNLAQYDNTHNSSGWYSISTDQIQYYRLCA